MQYKRGSYPTFSFSGRVLALEPHQAVVYDPDTFFAAFPVESVMYEHSFRVEGIDSIENKIKKVDLALLTEIQKKALLQRREAALAFTNNLFAQYPCNVVMGKSDKYGRILCKVTFEVNGQPVDLSQLLIRNKLAFPYGGDTKLTIVEQAEFCINSELSNQII